MESEGFFFRSCKLENRSKQLAIDFPLCNTGKKRSVLYIKKSTTEKARRMCRPGRFWKNRTNATNEFRCQNSFWNYNSSFLLLSTISFVNFDICICLFLITKLWTLKWTHQAVFKSWTKLFAFLFALMALGKAWTHLFFQQWVNTWAYWVL